MDKLAKKGYHQEMNFKNISGFCFVFNSASLKNGDKKGVNSFVVPPEVMLAGLVTMDTHLSCHKAFNSP